MILEFIYYDPNDFKSLTGGRRNRTSNRMATAYTPIAPNIYKAGSSYRVRVRKNGKMQSAYFTSKKAALEFRKKVQS